MKQRRKQKIRQIRVYDSKSYDNKKVYLKLFELGDGRVIISVVDEYGHRLTNGNLLWIDNNGASVCNGVGEFDIKKDDYGRVKVNG